ncbi:hypothetical protein TAMA11512_24030 [Selenomonas sp. TAMA-11512]|nr:hypothetical protein TAMA11512_24030 [Selenomonas sp. TAMA-11512]
MRIVLEKNKARGVSSIVYDRKTKTIYELKSDGQRVPIRVRCDEKRTEEA